jgi:hypothetical protein
MAPPDAMGLTWSGRLLYARVHIELAWEQTTAEEACVISAQAFKTVLSKK